MKKLFWSLLIVLLSLINARGQRTWFEFEVAKSLGEKFEIALAPQIRFKEELKLHEYFFEPKIEYDFNKYFALGANYRVGNNPDKDGKAQWYGRYTLDAKTGYDWKNFETQFRLRYTNFDDFGGDESNASNYLRFRLQLEYNIEKIDMKPYISYELYRNLVQGVYERARWESGLEYKFNKHHRVGVYFRLNDYLASNDESLKIIGISYKFKL